MKAIVVLCVLISAMADKSKAQDGPYILNGGGGVDPYYSNAAGGGGFVISNPDPGFYQNPGGYGGAAIINPDPFYYQQPGGNGVHVVDNSGSYRPNRPYRPVPDSYNRGKK